MIEQPGRILRAVFHPSNGTILTASAENVAQLWDLVDRQGNPTALRRATKMRSTGASSVQMGADC